MTAEAAADSLRDLVRTRRMLPSPVIRRAIREAAGASQADVGRSLRVSRATVCRWESGKQTPRGEHLAGYVRALAEMSSVDLSAL